MHRRTALPACGVCGVSPDEMIVSNSDAAEQGRKLHTFNKAKRGLLPPWERLGAANPYLPISHDHYSETTGGIVAGATLMFARWWCAARFHGFAGSTC
jgi:hypothetical protein